MIAGSVAMLGLPLTWMIQSLFINTKVLTECEKAMDEDLRNAHRLQKKLKRAVEKEVPEMSKQLVVLEFDISRYASLQKLDCDRFDRDSERPNKTLARLAVDLNIN